MEKPNHRVRVKFVCQGGCEHELCYLLDRGVPPELRCEPQDNAGYSRGGGGSGCVIPPDLGQRIEAALRFSFEESKRQGHVIVRA